MSHIPSTGPGWSICASYWKYAQTLGTGYGEAGGWSLLFLNISHDSVWIFGWKPMTLTVLPAPKSALFVSFSNKPGNNELFNSF